MFGKLREIERSLRAVGDRIRLSANIPPTELRMCRGERFRAGVRTLRAKSGS
jgi:hypothetical protein